MNADLLSPFVESTQHAFKTMLNRQISADAPKTAKTTEFSYDISAIIGLSGKAQGVVALCFPQRVALAVVSQLLGAPIQEMGPDIADGIGEMVNIVAGYAKAPLQQYSLLISLPSVVTGPDHDVSHPRGIPKSYVTLRDSSGPFALELSLKPE